MTITTKQKPTLFANEEEAWQFSAHWELKISDSALSVLFIRMKKLANWHATNTPHRGVSPDVIDAIALRYALKFKSMLIERISDTVADCDAIDLPGAMLWEHAPELWEEFEAEHFRPGEDGEPSRFARWLGEGPSVADDIGL